ncbi:MAG TPA: TIGR03885 family FMN-dependent LLM class oxidoreductase [Acidimicrobiia bacterium]
MPLIGYHASHEQVAPSALLDAVRDAEQAGFGAAMCSDHLAPWGRRQGQSGHAWSWLGAALEATSFSLGVVTAPVQRYHPAVSAQAIGTLSEMYPGRFWAALGSGEALNEHVTGDQWPPKPMRDARLLEAVDVIQRLLRGDEVSAEGQVRVDRARVWSLPEDPPLLFGAAVSEETARTVGGWADGLITVNQPVDVLEKVVAAFREDGGDKPVHLQVHLSWADSEHRAAEIAYDQWRTNVFGAPLAWNLETPDQFDEAARFVRAEDVQKAVFVSSDIDQHIARLSQYADIGFDQIYLHHVGKEQTEFIRVFGEHVLPAFHS